MIRLFQFLRKRIPLKPNCPYHTFDNYDFHKAEVLDEEVYATTVDMLGIVPGFGFKRTWKCLECGDTVVRDGVYDISFEKVAEGLKGYSRDTDGWPLDPEGNRLPFRDDEDCLID